MLYRLLTYGHYLFAKCNKMNGSIILPLFIPHLLAGHIAINQKWTGKSSEYMNCNKRRSVVRKSSKAQYFVIGTTHVM